MSARLLGTSDADLEVAAGILRDGGLVAFPTETVYGLGANAFDSDAVARVFEAKARPHFDPLIVHVGNAGGSQTMVSYIDPLAQKLIAAFWPGALTLVLPKGDAIPSLVTSGLDTVAVRMPSHPVANRLIQLAGVPLAAPSANRFGRLSPTRAEHVMGDLSEEIDAVIDGGATDLGLESTILEVVNGDLVRILRHGAIAREDIENVLGFEVVEAKKEGSVSAPGQLAQHYAPITKLVCVKDDGALANVETAGYLAFSIPSKHTFVAQEVLSAAGDLREAASNLFDALHRLDESGATIIYAQIAPEEGVGRAINDRLRRAAATWS